MNLATLTTKRFRHTDSTLRGPNAYEGGKAKDTAETFGAQTNPAYSTLDRNTRDDFKSQEDPGYATPDIVRKSPDVKANPFYGATPNFMGKGYDDIQADPGYQTPDVKRKEMNASGHSTFDAQDSNSDIKRVEVNGDLYALPNKGTVKVKLFRLTAESNDRTCSLSSVDRVLLQEETKIKLSSFMLDSCV